MLAGQGRRRPPVRGKGAWKSWAPPAICRAAFAPAGATSRSVASDVGGSGSHASKCKHVVASVISRAQCSRQQSMIHSIGRESLDSSLKSVMFDETKLPKLFRLKSVRKIPILARHGQITLMKRGAPDVNQDDIMPPVALRRATASCTWSALKGVLLPDGTGSSAYKSKFHATLVSCDSGASSVLTVKHLRKHLYDDHVLLVNHCVQHQTGHIIDGITRRLNILSPCFCMSNVFAKGDLFQGLRGIVWVRVQRRLHILSPGEFSERFPMHR